MDRTTVRLPVIKALAPACDANPIFPLPNKASVLSPSSRIMNRGGAAATPRTLMNMVTPTTDQLVQVWAFVCSWIQEKVEHDMPASIPGFGTVLVIAHSHNIRIPHCVIHHAFANKYGLDTDADGSFQASSALEYRDIAVNCNIQEYTAKSWLEHILDNIGSHMRTQPLVELSLGVGILTCKNRYVDGHLMQKQPVEAEAPPVEPKKQTQPHPR